MFTDRDYDIWYLEAQILNEKIEQEWRIEKLGKRGKQNANQNSAGQSGGAQGGAVGGAGGPAQLGQPSGQPPSAGGII